MKYCVFLLLLSLLPPLSLAQQQKELDFNVNYDESRTPSYMLPALLETAEGIAVSSPEAWYTMRRPQLVSLFSNVLYGKVPLPESPLQITYHRIHSDPTALNGKAERNDIRIQISNMQKVL